LAGVAVEVGSGVTRFKPGDDVFAGIFDLSGMPESAAALEPAKFAEQCLLRLATEAFD
jgi:NADPH:quinone reductase-like Zn-dependent oxidoreductase